MTLPANRPPAVAGQHRPPAERRDRQKPPEKPGIEDHMLLLLALAAVVVVLGFTAMIVLTALGGGTDYVPWNG